MGKKWQWLASASFAVALLVVASGCTKTKVPSNEAMAPSAEQATPAGQGTGEAENQGMAMAEESLETAPSATASSEHRILEGRTSAPMLPVYFDFDKSNIRKDQQSRIEKDGDFLKANPNVSVRIEGNCDERGTDEYNLALGERRALSAKKYLMNLGIDGSRIRTLSYGEEKPLMHGHDELAWAQNRRDDFVILD